MCGCTGSFELSLLANGIGTRVLFCAGTIIDIFLSSEDGIYSQCCLRSCDRVIVSGLN